MERKFHQQAKEVAEHLTLLAHPMRLMIVCLLLQKELCASEILAKLGTTKGNLSQHLKLLILKKMIVGQKEGNRVYYRIIDPRLKKVIAALKGSYCPEMNLKI